MKNRMCFCSCRSVGWIIDKVVAMKRGPDQSIRQRDEQIARLLEEIKLQKERMNEEIAKLTELVAQRDTRIIDLQSALQVAEIRLSASEDTPVEREQPVQQEIDLRPADPMTALISSGAEAQFCLRKSKRLALAAVKRMDARKSACSTKPRPWRPWPTSTVPFANDKVRGFFPKPQRPKSSGRQPNPKARDSPRGASPISRCGLSSVCLCALGIKKAAETAGPYFDPRGTPVSRLGTVPHFSKRLQCKTTNQRTLLFSATIGTDGPTSTRCQSIIRSTRRGRRYGQLAEPLTASCSFPAGEAVKTLTVPAERWNELAAVNSCLGSRASRQGGDLGSRDRA